MPLLLSHNYEGLDPKLRSVIEDITARIQAWAGQVDGINAAERLNELTTGIASLPTVRTGVMEPFAGASTAVPSGYLLCDGSGVSRATYANLYAVIGTTWGAGDGSTTFNIPDGRGRYFFGKATSGTGSTLGGTFGTKDHTHTGPSHTHTGPSHTHTISNDSGHTHALATLDTSTPSSTASADTNLDGSFASFGGGAHDHSLDSGATGSSGSHDHTGVTGSGGTGDTGASGTGNTGTANPPSFVGNWIIKT
jgi:microcystin-dependent protein